jgi:hypothetical protein
MIRTQVEQSNYQRYAGNHSEKEFSFHRNPPDFGALPPCLSAFKGGPEPI